ncbi:MAG: hypothetical protein IIZ98_05425 [Erysipelotrichaceae bacterium]|nr:hypothetical protein [Erysipelotrichaceae bacterium]MBQ1757756.1 hypothetical protein [Erysipelotrichaceae bacterium]
MVFEVLFPEFCTMYADSINARYIEQTVKDIKVIRTKNTDRPYFADHDVDMIYVGAMPEIRQKLAIERLRPFRGRLIELTLRGKIILATGSAMDIFGKYIKLNGEVTEALGLFDYHVEQDLTRRRNSMFVGEFGGHNIVGYQATFSRIVSDGERPAFNTVIGHGNVNDETHEGFMRNNAIMTSLIGPLLVMNPHLTRHLLDQIGVSDRLAFEKDVIASYEYRLQQLTAEGAHVDFNNHGV